MQRKDPIRLEKTIRKIHSPSETRLSSALRENAELRKALARTDMIFESLASALAVIQGGKVKEITRKGLALLGYTRDEIQAMDFARIVHPADRSLLTAMQEQILEERVSADPQEIALVTREGEAIACDLVLHRTPHLGRAAFLAEITGAGARKEREKRLIDQKRDEIIGKLSSRLLKRLCPSVQALSDYVASVKSRVRLPGPSTVPDPELMSVAHELTSLIGQLQTLSGSEIESSRGVPFDLGKVVQDAISHLKRDSSLAGRQTAPIKLHCYLRQASIVEGDPVEIGNAVIGLLTSAMRAIPEGGDLYISAEENAGCACVYIQESGTSIPEDLMPKFADPFSAAESDGSDGLDLYMARSALKRHRGDLQIESSRGRGTTITLRMPLCKKGERNGKPCSRRRKDMWILILEEDHLIRELLFQVLSSKGFNVETVETLPECLEKFKSRSFDLVIAGAITADSHAMVRRIRKAAPQAFLALIGELGQGNFSDQAGQGSVDLVIGKPIDMNLAVNRISGLLIGRAK